MENFENNNRWIFLISVDGNTNKNISKNNNYFLEKNKKEIIIKEDSKIKNTINPNINEEKNYRIYSYSSISKSKIISNADSGKLYMSDFLKKPWKIKIKRLLLKLKKRYTKQSQKLLEGSKANIHNSFNINNNIIINENNAINFDNYQGNYNICESKRITSICNVNFFF